jgi:hypothetical protein
MLWGPGKELLESSKCAPKKRVQGHKASSFGEFYHLGDRSAGLFTSGLFTYYYKHKSRKLIQIEVTTAPSDRPTHPHCECGYG